MYEFSVFYCVCCLVFPVLSVLILGASPSFMSCAQPFRMFRVRSFSYVVTSPCVAFRNFIVMVSSFAVLTAATSWVVGICVHLFSRGVLFCFLYILD